MLCSVFAFSEDAKAAETKKSITISQPFSIGSTQLQPKTYTLRFNDTGDTTQVHFFDGKKEVASAPAKIVKQKNVNGDGVGFNSSNGTPQLDHVFFSNETLDFSNQAGSASGS